MVRLSLVLAALIVADLSVLARSRLDASLSEPLIYTGICGGSAAAPLDADRFVVADDEASQLRIYARDQEGPPSAIVDLAWDLTLGRHPSEVDIEGAARVGNRIYWISSHSRNQAGKEQPSRQRFFATDVVQTSGGTKLIFAGRPYPFLLRDLAASPGLERYNLRAASQLPPKSRGGLNIEGLCATEGSRLLIGLRNPVPNGKALLVPLENPDDLLRGGPAKAGRPIELDLGGLGIRDLAYWEGDYLIIAGAAQGGGKSKLYRWGGAGLKPKHLKDVDLKGLNPEAVVVYPDRGFSQVQLLSDDSTRQGGVDCKQLAPASRQFRAVWVTLEPVRRARP